MTTKTRSSRNWLILLLGAIAAIGIVPLFLGFEQTHADWSAESSNALIELSENERNDLNASYKQFNTKLEAADRDRMNEIHAIVKSKPGREALLDRYDEWYQQLSPFERDQINSAKSMEDRISIIEDLLATEEVERGTVMVELREDRLRMSDGGRRKADSEETVARVNELLMELHSMQISQLSVTTREFDAMVDVILAQLPPKARKAFNERVAEKTTPGADAESVRRVRTGSLMPAFFSLGVEEIRKRGMFWKWDKLHTSILDCLEDSPVRESLKSLTPDQQQTVVGTMVMRLIENVYDLSPFYPSDVQFKEFFAGLDREVQIKMLPMSPETSKRRVRLMYLQQTQDMPEDIREMAERMLYFLDRRRERGSGRGNSGRGKSSRGSSRNRGGRRGEQRPQRPSNGDGERPPRGDRPDGPPPPPPGGRTRQQPRG